MVSLEEYEAGKGRTPDIRVEFGYFPTSVVVLSRPPELYKFLADNKRFVRHKENAYHKPMKVSIFPPAAAWFCLKFWSREGDLVLDPFGNRANIGLVANWLGRQVVVNDIVPSYCELMRAAGARRARKDLPWRVLNQDAARLKGVGDSSVDFILTGPPYFNIEKYEDVPGQASSLRSYNQFLGWYVRVAQELLRAMKPGGFCALKVGNWRRNGRMIMFARDTLDIFEKAGWRIHDELICVEPAPLALAFSWASKWKRRHVHKAHQTVLVFKRAE